jgi:hypothetical protein
MFFEEANSDWCLTLILIQCEKLMKQKKMYGSPFSLQELNSFQRKIGDISSQGFVLYHGMLFDCTKPT